MCSLEELKKNINSFNNETINIIPKIKIESNYVLDQFNIRERKLEYQSFISKNKKEVKDAHPIQIFESADKFMDTFEKNRYLKKWNRLDEYAQKIKLTEFFQKWLIDNRNIRLSAKELTNKIVIQHALNKRLKIHYDETKGEIVSIDKLEQYIN
jgi:hypothetical protein